MIFYVIICRIFFTKVYYMNLTKTVWLIKILISEICSPCPVSAIGIKESCKNLNMNYRRNQFMITSCHEKYPVYNRHFDSLILVGKFWNYRRSLNKQMWNSYKWILAVTKCTYKNVTAERSIIGMLSLVSRKLDNLITSLFTLMVADQSTCNEATQGKMSLASSLMLTVFDRLCK